MRIGFLVDGQAEPEALQYVFGRIQTQNALITRPRYADMQPRATPLQIAKSAEPAVRTLLAKRSELIVVLIDQETGNCPPILAPSLKGAFERLYPESEFEVVVKARKLENWLIADLQALREQPGRFDVTDAIARRVMPNRADGCIDSEDLINRACIGTEYHKRKDPVRIAQRQDPLRLAANSRSFRRLLRVIGEPNYIQQSKDPIQHQ